MPVLREDLADPHHRPGVNIPARRKPYAGMSPRDVYGALCRQHGCKVNSGVSAQLSGREEDFDIEELDVRSNLLGPKGVIPLLEVARLSSTLQKVNLQNNYLDNASVRSVATALQDHPTLQELDFSGNPISWTAGMYILDLTKANTSLQNVRLEGTFLKPNILASVSAQTKWNQAEKARKRAIEANPTNHPIAIRLRALRRLFNEIAEREGEKGRIPKRCAAEGYKENMRMQSREAELEKHSIAFYEELKRRCNADAMGLIDWDTFMIVSMVDDIWFDNVEVSHIKTVFQRYDEDGNGYIDLAELKEVVKDVFAHAQPSDELVQEKMKIFDADGSNTLTLDEFLIMMVDKGPQVGATILLPEFPSSQPRPRHF